MHSRKEGFILNEKGNGKWEMGKKDSGLLNDVWPFAKMIAVRSWNFTHIKLHKILKWRVTFIKIFSMLAAWSV